MNSNKDKPFLSSPQFLKHRPKQVLSLQDGSLTVSDFPQSPPQNFPRLGSLSIPDIYQIPELSLCSSNSKDATARPGQVKAQFSIGHVPVVVKDQTYIKRKKTVDTFLKIKDLEVMLGINQKSTRQINRNTSLGEVGVLHHKLKRELMAKEKFKRGKMYANELWSTTFYNTIIDVSDLKKKSDNLSKLKFKNIDFRIEEVEEYYNKLTEKANREQEQTLREVKESPFNSLKDINELSPIKGNSESHRPSPPLKNSTMAAFFKRNRATPIESPKSSQTNDQLTHVFSHRNLKKSQHDFGDFGETDAENMSPNIVKQRPHRQRKFVRSLPEELHIQTEDYSPDIFNVPSLVSPKIESSTRFKTGYTTSSASIFSGYRYQKGANLLLGSVQSFKAEEESPDNKSLMRNTSLENSNLFQQSALKMKSKTPRSSRNLQTEEKRITTSLIKKCMNFNHETQELKKELENSRNNLDAFIRRKEISRAKARKEKAMIEALETQKKILKNRKNA